MDLPIGQRLLRRFHLHCLQYNLLSVNPSCAAACGAAALAGSSDKRSTCMRLLV